MHTHYLATLVLDTEAVGKDLEQAETFHWSEAYSDYLFGGAWKSCMLWAPGADGGDGVVTSYDYERAAGFTDQGRQLPYLSELIASIADRDRLNFVRLAKVAHSVVIPHRDLLELNDLPEETRNAHRMHLPLQTNPDALFCETDTAFHMSEGELWFLDASKLHSVAALSHQPRIHMMFDFVGTPSDRPLVELTGRFAPVGAAGDHEAGIPASRIRVRPPIQEQERANLRALAPVLNRDSYAEVFSIVIKHHFRSDGGADFPWDTMTELADACPDPGLPGFVREQRRHYTLERSTS